MLIRCCCLLGIQYSDTHTKIIPCVSHSVECSDQPKKVWKRNNNNRLQMTTLLFRVLQGDFILHQTFILFWRQQIKIFGRIQLILSGWNYKYDKISLNWTQSQAETIQFNCFTFFGGFALNVGFSSFNNNLQ